MQGPCKDISCTFNRGLCRDPVRILSGSGCTFNRGLGGNLVGVWLTLGPRGGMPLPVLALQNPILAVNESLLDPVML